jgi:signal transduction histidine kinase
MKTIEQKFQKEIEIERLWAVTDQGKLIFFGMLPISFVLVIGLWNFNQHIQLVAWLSFYTTFNFLRWMVLRFYYNHKDRIIENVSQLKQIFLVSALVSGLFWGAIVILFLNPTEPANVMLICITVFLVATAAVLTWFCYLPAMIVYIVISLAPLTGFLFIQGSRDYIVLALIILLFTAGGTVCGLKFAGMLNYALRLNFENAELRHESEEKSQLLAKALAEAEQANAAKTRFLAAASHDLRQPIHALGLFFAELSDRVYSPDTALVIGQVEDSIAAINSMLNALLDVSKLDAGVVKPTIVTFALSDLLVRLQGEFQPIALENHNELRMRPTTTTVSTDPAMLERMLRNLIGNALRYTKSGRVLVSSRRRGQYIEIQVFDTGSGIPEDQLEEIFVEFHQLQNPARDRRQGLGLGLAIVKRLGKLLRHKVKVVSRLGRGSCFSVTLPLAKATTDNAPEQQAATAYLPGNPLAGCHVLVLDDDIAVLEGMKGLLVRWGCKVTTAASPEEAMGKLAAAAQKLELLIIDYRLPNNVSGIAVSQAIQSQLVYPVAVLVITGDTGPDRLREADASGYPLLHKPVEPAKLRSTLQYLTAKLKAGG